MQISENRRENTYILYSNENENFGNKLLETQKKSELDTNSADVNETPRLKKRFLDCAEERPLKHVAKVSTVDLNHW